MLQVQAFLTILVVCQVYGYVAQKDSMPELNLKRATRGDSKDMYTAILSSKGQKKLATNLMDALQKGKIIVDGKTDVVPKSGGKSVNSQAVIEYTKSPKVTGLIIVSSPEVANFLKGTGGDMLQITGEIEELDSGLLVEAFKSNGVIRDKVLIVVPKGVENQLPDYMTGIDVLMLSNDKGTWGNEVASRFNKKVILRYSNWKITENMA